MMRSKEEYSDDAIVQFHINDFFMSGLHCFLQLDAQTIYTSYPLEILLHACFDGTMYIDAHNRAGKTSILS